MPQIRQRYPDTTINCEIALECIKASTTNWLL